MTELLHQASKRAAEQAALILGNDWVNAEYKHITVQALPPATTAAPGQFFHLLCPRTAQDAPFLRRPMSLYEASPSAGTIGFLYKITGAGTRGLAELRAGDTLNLFGPLGNGFHLEPGWHHILVIGRGVGLATLGPLSELAAAQKIAVTAILSARTPALVLSDERFRRQGADVIVVTDSAGTSGPAHIERILRGLIGSGKADAFFTCGSARILRVLQRLGHEFGIPGQVALEQQMACGLGMCYCCVREFNVGGETIHRRVCFEGPVFDMAEAMP